MATPVLGNPAGFYAVQAFTVNASGLATGQAGASPADGTTSHAYLFKDATAANFSSRSQNIVEFRGQDGIRGKMAFGSRDMQPFSLTADALDLALKALATGQTVNNSINTRWQIGGDAPYVENLPVIGWIFTQKFQSREAATAGTIYYRNVIIPSSTVAPNSAPFSHQAAAENSFQITPTRVSKLPNGLDAPFEADHFEVISVYPLAITAFIAEDSDTTFDLGYQPAVTTVTSSSNTAVHLTRNGTAEAASAVTQGSGAVTITSSSASDHLVAIYETEFAALTS